MRDARRGRVEYESNEEPPRQRRRIAGLNATAAAVEAAATAAAAPERRVTRQQARAQQAAAAAAAPRRNRLRARAQAVAAAPAGPEDNEQQNLEDQLQVAVQEEPAAAAAAGAAAGSDSEYEEAESEGEGTEDEDEDEESDDDNDRDAEVMRRLGFMPPGDESEEGEDEYEDEDEDEYMSEDYGEDEYEDEQDEDEEPEEEDDNIHVPIVLPGGRGWDIVVGGPAGTPARARGAAPQRLPGDQEITAGVWAREQPDQRHILYSRPLANCPKLLTRIFKMRQQPGQLVWKSDLALADREWQYLKGVFAHQRLRPLLHGRRVLQPLPDYIPDCFRPVDSTGRRLTGPRLSRNGKPWNMGRQFFSSFRNGDDSSFIWADGVRAMEPEAQESFREEMLGGGGGFYGLFGL